MALNLANLTPASIKAKEVATQEYVDNGISTSGYVFPSEVADAINTNTTTINGSKITTGTVNANVLASNFVYTKNINVNNRFTVDSQGNTVIKSARMEIANNVIKVYDTKGVLRVKIGDLSA